ncbi:MAG: hypothetical protein IK063_05210, partial [Clostridia bacterium]|nr:hypothetical protein [Clostridia bacterium]
MNYKKILAVITAIVCVATLLSACGGKTPGAQTTTAQQTTQAEETTAAPETTTATEGETETETGTETTTAEEKKIPETKEEILAAYTEIMNKAKKDAPAFKEIMYQSLPDDANSRVITSGKTFVNAALNLAGNFMTDEESARKKPDTFEKGGDMHLWPVKYNKEGCLLTDADALKDAKYEELPDGNVRITIVLKSETNPEPTPEWSSKPQSKTGSVFSPLSKKEIDENLNGGVVSAVFSDVNYSLTYHDCSSAVT